MNRLDNRCALITGASRGIGRQIAISLASLGCDLILHSRSKQHTEQLEKQLTGQGVQATSIAADLGDADSVNKLIDALQAGAYDIDILYNNAAIMAPHHADVWRIPSEEFRRSFEINLVSQIQLINALIPGMITRGWGRVVNLISDIDQLPQLSPYAVTKAALEKYTHDIVPALQDTGVYMNSLNPGWLRTDMGSEQAPDPVECAIPGALLPALLTDPVNGRRYDGKDYLGDSLEQAIEKANG